LYADGTSFCFSCTGWFKKGHFDDNDYRVEEGSSSVSSNGDDNFEEVDTDEVSGPAQSSGGGTGAKLKAKLDKVRELRSTGFRERGVRKAVTEFYGVKASFTTAGGVQNHYYPYEKGDAYKVRKVASKDFEWYGKSDDLFGREHFTGGGKRLVICEGEIDTLTMAQVSLLKYNKIYPTVGLSSSVMSKSLLKNRDWIRTFTEVVLMFDQDDAGDKATKEAIKIIGADKVKISRLGKFNDVNEMYMGVGGEDGEGVSLLMQAVFDAERHIPDGIIGKDALWEALINYNQIESHPYSAALAGINTKLKGKRYGEIALLISGTGSGKSTILREEMLNILETTPDDVRVGVVSLEEAPAETARKLAGMHLGINPAKEEIPLDQLKIGFDAVFGSDRVVLLDHQGSVSDNRIIDQLEYMCLSGCRYLFVDHITIMVSEGVENLTGNEAQDKVMNDLLRLVKKYPVWIGLVSHLRKAPSNGKSFEEGKLPSIDDIRGSGSIKQISFDIISFARDLTAESEDVRNTILMRVLKSRYTGLTGTVPGAKYNYDTGRLLASEHIYGGEDDFTSIG
jgi:twinkle protein